MPGLAYGSAPPSGMYKVTGLPAEAQLEEEPMYVNAKQYHRILKRRQARAKWDDQVKANKAKVPRRHHNLSHIYLEVLSP
jgi:hypothetical protein